MSGAVPPAGDGAARFATTRWSLVVAASERGSPEGSAALETLCRACWFPLYAFARRSGSAPEQAEDLVQGFFAALLEKGYLAAADRERGRFRTFLLAAFRHHASKEHERERAQKRGGGVRVAALDRDLGESLYLASPSDGQSAEQLFERRWALALLERALEDLRASYGGRGQSEVFEALRPHLAGGDARPLAEVGASLGLTEGATKVALHRLRGRYRDVLRAAIVETVASPAEVDDEIRHLLAALA